MIMMMMYDCYSYHYIDIVSYVVYNYDTTMIVCAPYYDDIPKTICRSSASTTYKIAYEMKVYSTYGGYNPCYEGVDCPEVTGLYIEVCKLSTTTKPPSCKSRIEKVWRYFSYGNIVPNGNTDGIGIITGRDYIPGIYNITTQTMTDSLECDTFSKRTTSFTLRNQCLGDEDFVLT